MSLAKPFDKLNPKDWEKYPVWTFDLENEGKPERDETWMVPVKKLPVKDLRNCGCRANAYLPGSHSITLVLWGIKLQKNPSEEAFWKQLAARLPNFSMKLQYSIWVNGNWWNWHQDSFLSLKDFKKYSSEELAEAMGLPIEQIFPFAYDISAYAVGLDEVLYGKIDRN